MPADGLRLGNEAGNDLNGDGEVRLSDFLIFAEDFGKTAGNWSLTVRL